MSSANTPAPTIDRFAPFERSADWYDRLHPNRNCRTEATAYLQKMFGDEYEAGAGGVGNLNRRRQSIVEWGAGTGSFTNALSAAGFDAIGVEPCYRMIQFAKKKSPAANVTFGSLHSSPFPAGRKFDAACAPFGVFGYAGITNGRLCAALRTVRSHLYRGSRLAFDVINLAAAASRLRTQEQKEARYRGRVLKEYRQKRFDAARSIIHFDCTFETYEADEMVRTWKEPHHMRAFAPTELELALAGTGFKVVEMVPWEGGKEVKASGGGPAVVVTESDWYFLVVAEAI